MKNILFNAGLRFLGVAGGLLLTGVAGMAADEVRFNRDIRPILSDKCFACHGPDKNTRKGKFRLDLEAEAKAKYDDEFPIVPGKPGESALIKRILSADPDEVMPPPKSNNQLTAQEKELLKRWIVEGAKYEAHWAFLPVTRPAVPPVQSSKIQIQNPIDNFLLARLEAAKLEPVPEADRRTLIRRLSFDLTGLPPTPEEVKAFVKSKDPKAYEKLVDRLLASPRYGERMAMPWLDLVRYADSVGYHGDQVVSIWPFRDYVINAFNTNMPFDQFTREQLAGDLLTNATTMQQVASGYNRLGMMSTEGGIQDKEYLAKYSSDRVRNASTIWLGATLGCAECHDHKFDPYSTKDFYRFASFFADLKEKGFYKEGGNGDWGPQIKVPSPAGQTRMDALDKQISQLTDQMAKISDEKLAGSRARWEATVRAAVKPRTPAWSNVAPVKTESAIGSKMEVLKDSEILVSGRPALQDEYNITIPARLETMTALRLEVLKDDDLPGNKIARAGLTFYLGEIELTFNPGKNARAQTVKISSATADGAQAGYPILAAFDGRRDTAWSGGGDSGRQAVFKFAQPLSGSTNATLSVRLIPSAEHPQEQIGKFRLALISNVEAGTIPADVLAAITAVPAATSTNAAKTNAVAATATSTNSTATTVTSTNAASTNAAVAKTTGTNSVVRKDTQEKLVAKYYRNLAPELEELRGQLNRIRFERDLLPAKVPTTFVSQATTPRVMRVLARGNWMDDAGEVVEPGVPHFLKQIEKKEKERATRLDLANWLTAAENPLTARVFVNRLWKMYFGTGLSRNLDDLGAQGEWPQHLNLLDWMSAEFMADGWDVKKMIRLMVNSSAYRRAADSTPQLDERDPANRLVGRQSRFRLDAEMIRDNALATSGLLAEKQGGPSVKPVQPPGYWASLNFPKREYASDGGELVHRRGLYTHWQRTFLHPSLLAFDAPSREECTVNRPVSNTPLQALVLLNDPIYVEAARAFAEKIARQGGRGFDTRLAFAFESALARPPQPEETKVLRGLFEQQLKRYQADKDAARRFLTLPDAPAPTGTDPEMAAWMQVSRAILNLHETLTRN